jgi:hypothetical protein
VTDIGSRIARNGHVIEIPGIEAGLGQAPPRRAGWEPRGVLYPGEALFLDCGDELSVDQQRCGGIPVECIQPEDGGHGGMLLVAAGALRVGTGPWFVLGISGRR